MGALLGPGVSVGEAGGGSPSVESAFSGREASTSELDTASDGGDSADFCRGSRAAGESGGSDAGAVVGSGTPEEMG